MSKRTFKGPHFCYLIVRPGRTYVGYAKDPLQRLRKHNREIKGGACATAAGAGTWAIAAVAGPFKTRFDALSFEWYWKHKARGLSSRLSMRSKLLKTRFRIKRGLIEKIK